jgi:iron complex outermembrane receptor protein
MGQIDLTYEPARSNATLTSLDVQVHAQQTLHTMDNENKPTFSAGTFPNGMPRPPLRISVNAEIQNVGGRVAAQLQLGDWKGAIGGDVLYTYRNATRPFRAVMMNGMEVVPPFYQSDRVWPGVTIAQQGTFLNLQRRLGAIRLSGTGRLDVVQSDADAPSDVFLQNASSFRDRPVAAADVDRSDVLWSGALTGTLPLTPVWSVSAGVGSVSRPLQALELYSDRIPASRSQTSAEFQGNPFLDPERSTQVDLWVEGQGERWSLQASGFARRLDNYVTLQPTEISPLLPLSPPTVFGYVNGEATFYGAEAQGAVQVIDILQLRGSGSYLWGRDETLDEPALGVTPLSLSGGARLAIPFRNATIQRVYVDGALTINTEQDRVASTRGEQVTDGWAVADLQAGMRLANAVDVRFTVENVFDTSYTNHLSANNPFSGARIAEPGRVFAFTAAYSF